MKHLILTILVGSMVFALPIIIMGFLGTFNIKVTDYQWNAAGSMFLADILFTSVALVCLAIWGDR